MALKQVIVMRGDLKSTEGHKVRSGKLIAQGAHAAMGAILPYVKPFSGSATKYADYVKKRARVEEWLEGSFTKVTLKVNSLDELHEVCLAAKDAGLIWQTITDNGTTEFGGVPTVTCAAIGPATEEELAPITGHLKTF